MGEGEVKRRKGGGGRRVSSELHRMQSSIAADKLFLLVRRICQLASRTTMIVALGRTRGGPGWGIVLPNNTHSPKSRFVGVFNSPATSNFKFLQWMMCELFTHQTRKLLVFTNVHDVLDDFLLLLRGVSLALSWVCKFSVRIVLLPLITSFICASRCFLQSHIQLLFRVEQHGSWARNSVRNSW